MKRYSINKIDAADKAHIQMRDDIDPEIFATLMQICPAQLYWRDADGMHYDYTGCLECGVCRIIAGEGAFLKWDFPANGKGVDYSDN